MEKDQPAGKHLVTLDFAIPGRDLAGRYGIEAELSSAIKLTPRFPDLSKCCCDQPLYTSG
jgi:hypothetical protein